MIVGGGRGLAGKALLGTGAGRGIGRAIARRAARDGAKVTVAAKTETPDPRLPGTIFTAAEEIEVERPALQRLGAVDEVIETFGEGVVDPQTTVLRIFMGERPDPRAGSKKSRARAQHSGPAPASTW